MIRIISGAQNGVDQAALRAARRAGMPTGGWVTKNCMTLDGEQPALIHRFNLTELGSNSYRMRTRLNVKGSHATLAIARSFATPGERCTSTAARDFNKPILHILKSGTISTSQERIVDWICKHVPEKGTLNIAGNSERSAPGIGEWSEEFLFRLFQSYQKIVRL